MFVDSNPTYSKILYKFGQIKRVIYWTVRSGSGWEIIHQYGLAQGSQTQDIAQTSMISSRLRK